MATISAAGIGSGLDVESIVTQLMAIERQPLNLLSEQKSQLQTQLSGYGQLRSALDKFQTAMDNLGSLDKFKVYTATSGDEDAFTATASSSASTGNLAIEVQNLAVAHRMGSASFTDRDTTAIGNAGDEMTITVDGGSFTVDIGGQTLEGIRDAINQASDNVGVTATILQENDSSFRLVLSSDETGTANAINLSYANGGSPITDPLTMTTTVAAEDAQILVDNSYTITRSSNAISDAIQGVTLNLKAETTGAVNLNVSRDVEEVTGSVQSFVDAYNTVRSTITSLREGNLAGDNALLSIERQIQSVLNTPASSGTYQYLVQVGVSVDKNGTMSVDTGELETALQTDFSAVADLFAADGDGYAYRLEEVARTLLQTDGLVDSREEGINTRIDGIDDRSASLEQRLTLVEDRYYAQYSALDTLISQLNTTSSYLTQQLASLNSGNN